MQKKYSKRQYPILAALRAIRNKQRLRLDVLAEMIGYHWVTVSRWERGEKQPSLQALHDWCEALGVTLALGMDGTVRNRTHGCEGMAHKALTESRPPHPAQTEGQG